MNVMFDLTNLIFNKKLIYKHLSNIKDISIEFEQDPELGNYYFCFNVDVTTEPEKLVEEMGNLTQDQIQFFNGDEDTMMLTSINIIEEDI